MNSFAFDVLIKISEILLTSELNRGYISSGVGEEIEEGSGVDA